MNIKKLLTLVLGVGCLLIAAACGSDSSSQGKYYLTANEVNYFTLEENPQDLSALGEAINGTKNMIVGLDAPSSDYILNSLSSLGEVSTENFTLDINLNGAGDYTKLGDLKTIAGLTSMTIAGINDFNDASVFSQLQDLKYLTLKDQKIQDLTPLSQAPSLTDLSLTGNTIDYTTLPELDLDNINIPVADNNWVALTLLKDNENLKTINTINKDAFNIGEFLEPEQQYYNYQFEDVEFITKKKQEITETNEGNPQSLTGNMTVAASPGLLQPEYYSQQALLNTACGISEDEENPAIFFPYILDYATAGTDSTFLKLAGTEYMNQEYITAIDPQESKYIVYVYGADESGNFITDYSAGQVWVYAQIYDTEANVAYSPYLIYQSALSDSSAYQNEIINGLNTYLSGIPVDTF